MQYSRKFKEKIIAKASTPGVSANQVARKAGIPPSTLFTWLSKAKLGSMSSRSKQKQGRPSNSSRKSAAEKLRILNESFSLSEEELGAFLRKEGLHMSGLEEVRLEALAGLAPPKRCGPSTESIENKKLKRDLRRKEKALAEAMALLVLQKKFRALMEDEGDDTSELFGDDS